MTEFFELTENHIKLLQHVYVNWNGCEFGAPAIDCKRPYGDSSVDSDIARILDIEYEEHEDEETREKLEQIHIETQTALQIILKTRSFETGKYQKMNRYDDTSWKKVE